MHLIKSLQIILSILLFIKTSLSQEPIENDGRNSEDIQNGEILLHRLNRHFPKCECIQKLRTSYLTSDVCGQSALCYWQIWNYKKLRAQAKNETYDEECDKYMVQKYACLIGYPKPFQPNQLCVTSVIDCDKKLAKILYEDCEPIRKSRGLPVPQHIDVTLKTKGLNYELSSSKDHMFLPKPSSERPVTNNYYRLSCPIVYRYPFFTIALLLKELDSTIDYDETKSLFGVGQMLPKFLRNGVNNERILNFDALSVDQSMIHWCAIPKNYICVTEELDPDSDVCTEAKLAPKRAKCES